MLGIKNGRQPQLDNTVPPAEFEARYYEQAAVA